jgi:hypothetical protein
MPIEEERDMNRWDSCTNNWWNRNRLDRGRRDTCTNFHHSHPNGQSIHPMLEGAVGDTVGDTDGAPQSLDAATLDTASTVSSTDPAQKADNHTSRAAATLLLKKKEEQEERQKSDLMHDDEDDAIKTNNTINRYQGESNQYQSESNNANKLLNNSIGGVKGNNNFVGVVGPNHQGGNERILTQDFVHRTHLTVFGDYYPRELSNWWVDDWMTRVYSPSNPNIIIRR